jgi:hypothetical protein
MKNSYYRNIETVETPDGWLWREVDANFQPFDEYAYGPFSTEEEATTDAQSTLCKSGYVNGRIDEVKRH